MTDHITALAVDRWRPPVECTRALMHALCSRTGSICEAAPVMATTHLAQCMECETFWNLCMRSNAFFGVSHTVWPAQQKMTPHVNRTENVSFLFFRGERLRTHFVCQGWPVNRILFLTDCCSQQRIRFKNTQWLRLTLNCAHMKRAIYAVLVLFRHSLEKHTMYRWGEFGKNMKALIGQPCIHL